MKLSEEKWSLKEERGMFSWVVVNSTI